MREREREKERGGEREKETDGEARGDQKHTYSSEEPSNYPKSVVTHTRGKKPVASRHCSQRTEGIYPGIGF